MNKVLLMGRIGKEPTITSVGAKGTLMSKFSLATTERNKITEWHNIVAFGKLAEVISKYVHKGDRLYVEGKISTSEYEKDGVKRRNVNIIMSGLEFIESRKKEDATPAAEPEPHNMELPGALDDEVVF